MKELAQYLKELLRKGFPGKYDSKSYIIDSTHPLTSNIGVANIIEVMSDATGLIVVDTIASGGNYPTAFSTGYITYGNFTSISVTEGIVKAYLA